MFFIFSAHFCRETRKTELVDSSDQIFIPSLTDSKRDVSANMGKGNAQQAAQKRERNAKKNATSTASSQLKSNEKALSIICNVCKVRYPVSISSPLRVEARSCMMR